jgi:small subunit ribosomal protein S4
MRYTGPKARRVRRQGTNLYGSEKYDRILQRKPHGPGKDPKARRGKLSEYGEQLKEKQKARDMFMITERQFQRIYDEASRATGKTDVAMKQMLERRLDNAIYKAGFARSRLQARQFAAHGLFKVNGQRVTVASYRVSPGDKIAIREQTKGSPIFESILQGNERYSPPAWIKSDPASLSFEVIAVPAEDQLEQAVDMRKVVEFYSR